MGKNVISVAALAKTLGIAGVQATAIINAGIKTGVLTQVHEVRTPSARGRHRLLAVPTNGEAFITFDVTSAMVEANLETATAETAETAVVAETESETVNDPAVLQTPATVEVNGEPVVAETSAN